MGFTSAVGSYNFVMSAFVDSYLETVTSSVHKVSRQNAGRLKARRLLKVLADKKRILVTSHLHPDPDAVASAAGMLRILETKLPDAIITLSIKGSMKGGVNEGFLQQVNVKLTPWDEASLSSFDAIILLDAQPPFASCPLPQTISPTAVIDHHRSATSAKPKCPFCDIRTDVGATSSIIFSYFLELEVPIDKDLATLLLYAIESDLAGAAGQPGELDNVALSSLTLLADTRKLYQMRYADLPQSLFVAYGHGIANAVYYDHSMVSFLGEIDSTEKPALVADFLLRFEPIEWCLVSAIYEAKLIFSLRTADPKASAADVMRSLMHKLGQGGGHRTKAGGFMSVEGRSTKEIDQLRALVRKRFLRKTAANTAKPKPLMPPALPIPTAV